MNSTKSNTYTVYSGSHHSDRKSNAVYEEPIKPITKSLDSIQKSIENIHEEVKSEIYDARR